MSIKCRRCGAGKAREDGLCLSCKADDHNKKNSSLNWLTKRSEDD